MRQRLVGILLFQAAWFACALGGASGTLLAATVIAIPVILWNLLHSSRPWHAAALTGGAVLVGPLADAALVSAGLLGVAPPPVLGVVMPAWWLLLWASFASSLPVGLDWLAGRPVLAAVTGAVAGPASYWAGARLGALAFPSGATPGLVAVGLCWLVLCPLLAAASARLVPPRAAPPPTLVETPS